MNDKEKNFTLTFKPTFRIMELPKNMSNVNPFLLTINDTAVENSNITLEFPLKSDILKIFSSNFSLVKQWNCYHDMLYIIKNIKTQWTSQMIDSYGKIPSGVLRGNLLWTGKYDECVKVNVSAVKNETSGFLGRYCTAQWNVSLPGNIDLPVQDVPIKTGICLPDSCASIDIKKDIGHFIDLLYHLPLMKQFKGDFKLAALKCADDDSHFSFSAILFLCFLGVYLLLPLAGSLVSVVIAFSNDDSCLNICAKKSPDITLVNDAISREESLIQFEKGESQLDHQYLIKNAAKNRICGSLRMFIWQKIGPLLKCFCVFSSASQILNTKSSKRQFGCLHGIKFFSMTWVILGHTYVHNLNYIDNYLDLLKGVDNLPFQAIMQGTFSVDTFFLISGFLLGYLYLEEAEKRKGKINLPGLFLHRFLRISPVYLFLIGFASLLFKYLGSGPFWEEADDVSTCKKFWWWNLLYINNFQPINSMCLTWTWYLANDMQFFILSSFILNILWRWKNLGIGIFFSFLVMSWTLSWYLSSLYDIPPLFMGISEVKNYTEYQGKLILAWDLLYSKPYCRIGPYIIGILLAYLMYQNSDKKIVMNIGVQVIGWSFATVCSSSVIYGLYHAKPNSILLNAYNAFGRSAFSLGIAWVIFCCLTGHASIINRFLSYKAWIPLSRLTFCTYLFHPLIMNWYFQSRQVPLYFTHSTMIILYFSFLFMSYSVAFIISCIFEAPIINLEKLIFKR